MRPVLERGQRMNSSIAGSVARPRRLGRSVVALLAGMALGIVLSIATDSFLHAVGFFPPLGQPMSSPQLAVATLYRAIYGIVASYVIARLAPYQPLGHALIGGFIGLLASTAGAIATWNMGLGAHWYPVALIVIALPTAWIGGKLRLMQLQ